MIIISIICVLDVFPNNIIIQYQKRNIHLKFPESVSKEIFDCKNGTIVKNSIKKHDVNNNYYISNSKNNNTHTII